MAINKDEPKVLVIAANPFSDINNNGKTLKSIFNAFQKESLCELYFRPQDNVIADGNFADSYYAVSDMDIIRSMVKLSNKCGGVQTFEKKQSEAVVKDKTYQWFLHGNMKNIKWLRKLMWRTRRWDTQEYREWYRGCKPDIVFALLGGPSTAYTIAQEIINELNIPLAVYFTDDYIINPIRKNWQDRKKYKKDEKEFRTIINNASIHYTISELMSQKYSDFFGKQFDCIMNSVDVYPFEPMAVTEDKSTIAYFGGLNLNRWKMISRLSKLSDGKARVIVYTGQEITEEIDASFKNAGVELGGFLKGDEVRKKMLESNMLLHIESDDEYYRALTCLSVSTKIPEYMMSSRPIIAFGPKEIASIRLVSDNDLALVISSEDDEVRQKTKLQELLDNRTMQQKYAKKAYDYAVEHFDKKKISMNLRNKLIEVCKNR